MEIRPTGKKSLFLGPRTGRGGGGGQVPDQDRRVLAAAGQAPAVVGERQGGDVALVAGENAGQSKVSKATDLGVPIIDEKQFLRLLSEGLDALS